MVNPEKSKQQEEPVAEKIEAKMPMDIETSERPIVKQEKPEDVEKELEELRAEISQTQKKSSRLKFWILCEEKQKLKNIRKNIFQII